MSRLIIALAKERTYTMMKTSGNKEDKKRLNETRPLPEQIFLGAKRRERTVHSTTLLWGLCRVSYLLTFATATERRGCSRRKKFTSRTFLHARILKSNENKAEQRQTRETLTEHVTSLSGTHFWDVKVCLSITHSRDWIFAMPKLRLIKKIIKL